MGKILKLSVSVSQTLWEILRQGASLPKLLKPTYNPSTHSLSREHRILLSSPNTWTNHPPPCSEKKPVCPLHALWLLQDLSLFFPWIFLKPFAYYAHTAELLKEFLLSSPSWETEINHSSYLLSTHSTGQSTNKCSVKHPLLCLW